MIGRPGRPPMGEEHIESLEGGEEERQRLRVILRTLSGEATIREAGEQLGLSDRRVHQVRRQALQGAIDALAARPAGRPPRGREVVDLADVAGLERELASTRAELEMAELRHELDVGLGQIAALEKKGPSPSASPRPNRAERRSRRSRRRRGV